MYPQTLNSELIGAECRKILYSHIINSKNVLHFESSTNPTCSKLCKETTIGNKIVETLYSNRVTTEDKKSTPLPHPVHSKLGCLLFSTGSLNSYTTLHGRYGGGKALLSPF